MFTRKEATAVVISSLQEKREGKRQTGLEQFLAGRAMVRQAELARALGVSQPYLSELASSGMLKVRRVGRAVLIPTEEVMRVFGCEEDAAA
jgi:excisionase family DNA binding protein